jgi:hypothetical protein
MGAVEALRQATSESREPMAISVVESILLRVSDIER